MRVGDLPAAVGAAERELAIVRREVDARRPLGIEAREMPVAEFARRLPQGAVHGAGGEEREIRLLIETGVVRALGRIPLAESQDVHRRVSRLRHRHREPGAVETGRRGVDFGRRNQPLGGELGEQRGQGFDRRRIGGRGDGCDEPPVMGGSIPARARSASRRGRA